MAYPSETTATPNTGAATWKVVKDQTGAMYLEIALTGVTPSGTDPVSAGAHVVRVPVVQLVS